MKYRRLKKCYFCSHFGGANSTLYNKRTYFILPQNSRNTQNFAPLLLDIRTEEHILFSHRTHGIHRICSTDLHVSTRKNSQAKAQRARSVMSFCSYVKIKFSHGSTEIHRNFASHVVPRKSASSAWDHPIPHGSLLPTTFYLLSVPHGITHYSLLTDTAPHGISVNSCPFVAQKNTSRYAQIRGDFSVYSVDCFPLTSSDSDFQFCVKFLTQRRKGRGDLWAHRKHGRTQNF